MRLKLCGIAASLALVGCGSSDDDAATTTTATTEATEVDVSTGTALNVGVLAIGSIDADSVGLGSSDLWLQDGDDSGETASARDSRCSDNGTPMNADGSRMTQESASYPQTAIYCAVAFNTGSPDSVLGAISIPGVFLCEAERAGAWDSDVDFTEAGNNVGDVTITLSTNCAEAWLIEALSDGGDGVYPLTDLTLTQLPATHGYDKKITMGVGDGPSDIYIRSSDNFIAAKSEGWAFSVDLTNNIVHYETLGESTSTSDNSSYVRRLRLRVEGELGDTGAFSSIASLQALKLEGRGVDEGWSEIVTLTGSPADGMAFNYYYEAEGFQAVEDGCSVSDCSAITRISATEAQVDTFHSNAQVDFTAHDANEGIIVFDTVDLSGNVTYDASR